MAQFTFSSCAPFGSQATGDELTSQRHGLLFRAASAQAVSPELLQRIEAILGLAGQDVARYADAKRGQQRAVRLQSLDSDAPLAAFMLAGDTRSQSWISALLLDQQAAGHFGRSLLVPGAAQLKPAAPRAQVVCSCFNITDTAIEQALATAPGSGDERLAWLQQSLKCGSNCGSCLPQLRRMTRQDTHAST
jgi:assimilatory nitrate reductase catalytic subunit